MQKEFKLPAGSYWIGDPCYIVPDHLWDKLLDNSDYFAKSVGEVDSVTVTAFNTAYGDGEYSDQLANVYGVDAGLIGIISIDQMQKAGWEVKTVEENGYVLGHIFEFQTDFVVSVKNGIMTLGHIRINTN